MATTIRLATPGDAAAIAAIYGPYCEASAVSFETAAPSADEMAARMDGVLAERPWLVLDHDGDVAGYAYASRHRDRAAYSWAVDTAVYVAPAFHRQGVGRALYTTLFALLRQQGYFRACAGVTLPNEASVRLHESVGFRHVGTYLRIGFKLGAWRDVSWYQADLQPDRLDPPGPVRLAALLARPAWDDAVSRGLGALRLR
jgi:phosphinothricin acetyltransferase